MTQQLTERDARRDIATYARIGLTDEELAQMTVDLNSIIETLKPITEFDLESVVDPTFHPIGGLSNADARRRGSTWFHAGAGAAPMLLSSKTVASLSRLFWAEAISDGV